MINDLDLSLYLRIQSVISIHCSSNGWYYIYMKFCRCGYFIVISTAICDISTGYIDGLVQNGSNSSALAMELLQSCT